VYKNLSIAVLLVAFGLVAARSTGTPAPNATSPVILKKLVLKNQTASIPTTTLFTPATGGLFRVSAYMTQTSPGTGSGQWLLQMNWTDDAGQEYDAIGGVYDKATQSLAYCTATESELAFVPCGATFVANAGTPVTYSVQGDGGGGTYEVFLVVERLI
jgi:hypothetical protein